MEGQFTLNWVLLPTLGKLAAANTRWGSVLVLDFVISCIWNQSPGNYGGNGTFIAHLTGFMHILHFLGTSIHVANQDEGVPDRARPDDVPDPGSGARGLLDIGQDVVDVIKFLCEFYVAFCLFFPRPFVFNANPFILILVQK